MSESYNKDRLAKLYNKFSQAHEIVSQTTEQREIKSLQAENERLKNQLSHDSDWQEEAVREIKRLEEKMKTSNSNYRL